MALYRRMSRQQMSSPARTEEELRGLIRTYAKTANQRLKELEKQGLSQASNAYRAIRDFAADNRNFITVTTGVTQKRKRRDTGESYEVQTEAGHIKFRTNLRGMSKEELLEEAKQLDTFLFEAKTSTVSGTKKHYQDIRDAIGRNANPEIANFFGNMDMNEFTQFWENHSFKKIQEIFGSTVLVQVFDTANENPDIGDDRSILSRALEEINIEQMDVFGLLNHVRNWRAAVNNQQEQDYDFWHMDDEHLFD